MEAREKSLRIYDSKKTFFSKLSNTFSKLLTPTKTGFNNLLIGIKRTSVLKSYNQSIECKDDNKKEALDKKFEEAYSLYLDSIDQLVIDTIYKRVKTDSASDFEKDALSKYYNVIRLKDTDELEYKLRKQKYLLELDYNNVLEIKKQKLTHSYEVLYMYEMENIFKRLLKHYSMKLTEKLTEAQKDEMYDKIFDTLEDYITNILPLKKLTDVELIKQCSLFETYEVGKLDQVDNLDKKMILLGISRKLFVHSLPLVIAEKCYVKLMKDARNLIVDTKIPRKRENAYQLLLRLFEQYNNKLLAVKIYWDKPEEKNVYLAFAEKCKKLEALREKGLKDYDIKKQILYIREDMKKLEKYNDKYFRILQFYRNRLVNLGDMRLAKKSCKTGKYELIESRRVRKEIQDGAAS